MGVDKIVKLVGVLVAVVAAFVTIPYSAVIVALLGIGGAWFIAEDDRSRFLIAAVALNFAHDGLDAITVVGPHISTALGGVNGLFMAAAATVIVLGIVDRLKP
ncbi:MAG: hypothetical protein IIA07_04770 [Proteobacteria bacterium]|nr:hypothetical protein [Pseudomonadota bacterium]